MALRGLSLLLVLALAAPFSSAQDLEQASLQALRGVKDQHQTSAVSPKTEGEEDAGMNTGNSGDARETKKVPAETEESQKELQMRFAELVEQRAVQVQRAATVMLVTQVVLVVIVGLIYAACPRYTPPPEEVRQQRGQDFQYGLCEGCSRSRICCCSFWCLPLRWAETASSVNFFGCNGPTFLLGFFIFELLIVLAKLPGVVILYLNYETESLPYFAWTCAAIVFSLALLVMQVLHRRYIRQRYGMENDTCGTCCCDCLVWIFCGCCAAMQEALQVEYVGEPVKTVGEVRGEVVAAVVAVQDPKNEDVI